MHILQGKPGNKGPLGTMQVSCSHQVEGVISLTFHQASRNLPYKPALIQILHSALRTWLQNIPMPSISVTQAESTAIK
eukprot:607771-Ditylum_brightwellii.AAC.1